MFWCSPRKRRRDSRDDSPLTPTSSEVEKNNPEDRTDAESCLPLESSKDSPYRSRRLSGSSDSASSYHTPNNSSPEPTPATVEQEEGLPIPPSTEDKMMQSIQENTKKLELMDGKIDTLHSMIEKNMKLIQNKIPHSQEVGRESSPDQLTTSVAQVEEKCAAGTSAQQQLVSSKQSIPLSSSNTMAKGKKPLTQNQHSKIQLPQKPCNKKTLLWLTTEVMNWKCIARELGLSDSMISRIEKDYPNDCQEQCYQMFRQWKLRYPENDTCEALGNALRKKDPELFERFVKKLDKDKEDTDF